MRADMRGDLSGKRRRRSGERGAALLTVLLLVAIVAVLAGTGLEKLRLATRLTGNAVALDQARALAFAAEALATGPISELLRRDPDRVTLLGGWSDRPVLLPFAGGGAVARVTDGGNCFNLNSLVTELDGQYVADPSTIAQFVRLARLVGVPGGEAIAAAATDWIDSDDQPLPNGAEDGDYRGLAVPYRTAGTLMADRSELRAVAGVTPTAYARLRPWLCTLPQARRATLNVNTMAPEQAPLLAMLLPDTLGVEGARALLLRRPPTGYDSAEAFWKVPALGGSTADPAAQAQVGVTSRWFALAVDVTIGTTELQERALIDATTLPARLVSRQWGEES